MRNGRQRHVVTIHVHHAPAVAEDELPGQLVFSRQAHDRPAAVYFYVMGRIAVPVQDQHAAAAHIDVRRVVPLAAHDQCSLPDLPPLVPGSSGQQRGDHGPFIDHETRRIQAVGGIAPVAQYVVAVEGHGTRSRVHGALKHNRSARTVKNQIGAGIQLFIGRLRAQRGGVPAHSGNQADVLRGEVPLHEGALTIGIRHIPQHVPAPCRYADGAVEAVHVSLRPLVAGTHLGSQPITASAGRLGGSDPFPSAGIFIVHVAGTAAVSGQPT